MSVYIGPQAQVSGSAQVYGSALVYGSAQVSDSAQVTGSAWVYGSARVSDSAQVTGSARVYGSAQVYGSAWVYGSARVYGSAQVSDSAWVYGSAWVAGRGDIANTRHVLTIGPVGSEGRHVTIHRHYDGPDSTTWGHLIVAGCWRGIADQLDHRIHTKKEHGWDEAGIDRWRTDYEGVIALARARTAEWAAVPLADEDHERWEQVTACGSSRSGSPRRLAQR